MSKMYNGSLNLTKIGELVKSNHPAVTTDKNGNKYINLTIWLNDQQDQYGNMSLSAYNKEDKQSVYLVTLKTFQINNRQIVLLHHLNRKKESGLPF